MADLEEMLRRRQDELRGRPQTRWERFYERLPCGDRVLDWIFTACCIIAGICYTLVAWARAFGGAH